MKRYRTTLYMLIFSLVLFTGACGAYLVVFSNLRTLGEKISDFESQIAIQNRHETELIATRQLLAATAAGRTKLDNYFVTTNETAQFIDHLGDLSGTAGVELTVVSVNEVPATQKNPDKKLMLTLSTRGTWNQMLHFVSLLEHMPTASRVTGMQLKSAGEDRAKGALWSGTVYLEIAKI